MSINNSNLRQFNVQHYAGPVSELPAKLPFGDYYFAEDIEILYKYNYQGFPISIGGTGGGTSYRRAEVFSSLEDGENIGDLAFVNTAQGTPWLPGTIGGSYYPSGWYLWSGTLWVSDKNSIANQFETNINSLNTKVDKVSNKGLSTNDFTNEKLTSVIDSASWISTNGVITLNHVTNYNNPHNVTKNQIGLDNVDNTSDINKPLSSSTISALTSKVDTVFGERLINSIEIVKLNNQAGINTGDQDISLSGNILSLSNGSSVSIVTDDLIIVTASKQNNTFASNVFTFVDNAGYTNNTKTLIYTGDLLTSAVHLFRYNSTDWNVGYTYSYILGGYNGVAKTITKT
tara:strand:- start:34 stop:1065 length:1032 start_codon:yes stop_codon:yes gene_type:complete